MMSERGVGIIRLDAEFTALIAEMEAIKTEVFGMVATNQQRADDGMAPAYDGLAFRESAEELRAIAERLRSEI